MLIVLNISELLDTCIDICKLSIYFFYTKNKILIYSLIFSDYQLWQSL